jgi:hypothetical protein
MDMPEWHLDRQTIAMLRLDWSWLPFSRSARPKDGGKTYNLCPVLLLEVVERTNPALVQQSRLRHSCD